MRRRYWMTLLFGPDLVDWVGKHYWNWKLDRKVVRHHNPEPCNCKRYEI